MPSNEVANGDSAEDKQVEDEDDPDDDIVDDNGFVNSFKSNGERMTVQLGGPDNGDHDFGFSATGTVKAMGNAEPHKPNRYSD